MRTEPRCLPHTAAPVSLHVRTQAPDLPAGTLLGPTGQQAWAGADLSQRLQVQSSRGLGGAGGAGPGQNWDTVLAELEAPPGGPGSQRDSQTHAGVGRQHVDIVLTQRVDDDGLAPVHQVGCKLENLQGGGGGQCWEADPSTTGP